jgi:hypothetical protein
MSMHFNQFPIMEIVKTSQRNTGSVFQSTNLCLAPNRASPCKQRQIDMSAQTWTETEYHRAHELHSHGNIFFNDDSHGNVEEAHAKHTY